MLRVLPRHGLAALAVALGAGLAPAQSNESPPDIIAEFLSTTPCATPTPWVFGADRCLLEGDVLYICLTVQDVDWAESDTGGGDDEGIIATSVSFWNPYFANNILYGPEPPAVTTDRAGALEGDFYFFTRPGTGITRDIQIPFRVPQFQGTNQARLRGEIDYDVAWTSIVCVRNGTPDQATTDADTPVICTSNLICAIENPGLSAPNPRPTADAGRDQVVALSALTNSVTVRLDGSRTFDGSNVGFDPQSAEIFAKDTLQYTWEWVSGPVRVDPAPDNDGNPATFSVTLTVPTPDNNPYVFRLLVQDGQNSVPSSDSVQVWVRTALPLQRAPRAQIAGPTESVQVGATITLDASGSTDPDTGDTANLLFRWRQTNEVGGDLASDQVLSGLQPMSGLRAAVAQWRAVAPGDYYFRVLVTDQPQLRDPVLEGQALSSAATYAVRVVNAGADSGQAREVQNDAQQTSGDLFTALPLSGLCGVGLVPLGLLPLAALPLLRRYMR